MRTSKSPVAVATAIAVAVISSVTALSCRRLTYGTFPLSVCASGHLNLAEAVAPSFTYAELRNTDGRVESSAGTKCRGAADVPGCEKAVAEATSQKGWDNGSHGRMAGHLFLVVTKGDTVKVIDDDAVKLVDELKPIDTPVKAAAMAMISRNLVPDCTNSVREIAGGYEVHLSTSSCFGPRDEVISVKTTGEVNVEKAWRGESSCVGSTEKPAQPTARYAQVR